jgi:hypothetical protein
MPESQHTAFAVGRITREGHRLMVLPTASPAPFPGPWELTAVTSTTQSAQRHKPTLAR